MFVMLLELRCKRLAITAMHIMIGRYATLVKFFNTVIIIIIIIIIITCFLPFMVNKDV